MLAKFEFGVFLSRHAVSIVYAIVCPSVWFGCSVPVVVCLDSSAVGIAQLAHTAVEFIFAVRGGNVAVSK